MDEKQKDNFVLPFSAILVTMAVIGGIWFYIKPLEGTRPPVETNICCEENVQARLWQDPFTAVDTFKKDTKIPYRSISSTKIVDKLRDDNRVTILGIMVSGGPYAEDVEWRLRMRYAAVSALNRLDYTPEDSQHIDYFESAAQEGKNPYSRFEDMQYAYGKRKRNQKLTVPFEWFSQAQKNDEGTSSKVLLLWLNDDKFQSLPLKKLSYLLANIIHAVQGRDKSNLDTLSVEIIGPASSTNLVSLIKEVATFKSMECSVCEDDKGCFSFKNLQIHSPFATADSTLLLQEALNTKNVNCPQHKNCNISCYMNRKSAGKIKLVRTIGSDRELCNNLIHELKLRRVVLAKDDLVNIHKNHIVLIAEWDTFYGRSLPETFINSVEKIYGKYCRNQLHRFSYLRGIDGQLPGESQFEPDKQETKLQTEENREEQTVGNMSRPSGRDQFDYLLRLTGQIRHLNNKLWREKQEKIMAIGVLGSDVYDKLLILQAMRHHFPDVIFFTTDLDARLLHQDDFKWSRNLIVASNFGLRLHDDIQGFIPAFRDNYQTSLFFSTLLTLASSHKIFENKETQLSFLQPRMFELGRRGAFDLTDNKQINKKVITINLKINDQKKKIELKPSTLYPKPDLAVGRESIELYNGKYLWSIGSAFVFVLFAYIYISSDTAKQFVKFIYISNIKNKNNRSGAKKKCFVWRLLALSLLVVFMIVFIYLWFYLESKLGREEPLSLLDGVSIWPTQILRLLSAFLSILFVFLIMKKIRLTDDNIASGLNLTESGPVPIKNNVAYLFPFFWNISDIKAEKSAGCLGTLWKGYLRLGLFRYRAMRAAIYTIFFVISCSLFIRILNNFGYGLFVPARGEFSFWIDSVVLRYISVPSMLFLTFFVVDAHKLFRRFIQLSSKQEKNCLPKVGIHYSEHAYQRILMLAEYTEQIKYSNIYPFIVLFLMIVARSSYFDHWNLNPGLLVIFFALGMYSFACTLILHKEVKKYRYNMVTGLKKEIICLKRAKVNSVDYEEVNFEKDQIGYAINAIESIQKGAFRPLIQHPLFQAAVLPIGGTSSLLFIRFFT